MIKIKRLTVAALICVLICMLSFTACDSDKLEGQSELLGAPKSVDAVDYSTLKTEGYKAFLKSVEKFAADFAAYSYTDCDKTDNFTVSPISVYMALALSAECADGDTRQEILDALNVSREQLAAYFSVMYRSLNVEHKADDKVTGKLNLSNSIWVNKGASVKQACISSLSDNYYAYSYSADFENNNAAANKAVRDFVKKQTNGLIDKDFQLSYRTLFTLINTLYLKTIWNTDGNDLPFADGIYDFTASDGSVKSTQLLKGEYVGGRAVDFESFTTFYARTNEGCKIKFIVPKDGYAIDQVFSSKNIAAVNSIKDYGAYDSSLETAYLTRVLFPEYKCKYDENIVDLLRDKFGIDLLFKSSEEGYPSCDFSALSDEPCYCSEVRHVTDLTVNRKGIEGAAVTMVVMDVESAGPSATINEDFIVNKAFGFVITDWQDVTLFSGVVNNV